MRAIQTVTTRDNVTAYSEERMPNGTSISKAIQMSGKGCCGSAYVERAH